jgi:benzoyl-CoA reductase/2-hydroxyglutaryl-CoA dehydratase subunit BcrC/BadD/HgdB
MNDRGKKAIDRIVELFEMSSALPEDVDVNLPEVQAFVGTLPEFLQKNFQVVTSDPDVRRISRAFNNGLAAYFNALRSARERGKKVVFVPFNFGPEILYAMDIVPVCVEVLTSMAQGLEEGVTEYMDLAVERGLPETMCSTHKGVIGLLEAGQIEKPDLIIDGALGACDPNAKAMEYLSERFGIPALYLDIPFTSDERALDYYTRGFKRIVAGLEKLTGARLDRDRLREVVEHSNQASEIFFEINELKRNIPNPVPNFYNQFHVAMKYFMVGTPEAVEFYRVALEVCRDRMKRGACAKPEERIRAFFMYTAFYFDPTIYRWLEEEMGVSFLMDIIGCFDFNPLIDTTSLESMLGGLAQEMMNLPMTRQLKGQWNMPTNWLDDTLFYAKTYNADCCIFSGHLACKQAWGAFKLVSDAVRRQLGIPVLRLEGDGWDGRITSMAAIKDRLEEFFAGLG